MPAWTGVTAALNCNLLLNRALLVFSFVLRLYSRTHFYLMTSCTLFFYRVLNVRHQGGSGNLVSADSPLMLFPFVACSPSSTALSYYRCTFKILGIAPFFLSLHSILLLSSPLLSLHFDLARAVMKRETEPTSRCAYSHLVEC